MKTKSIAVMAGTVLATGFTAAIAGPCNSNKSACSYDKQHDSQMTMTTVSYTATGQETISLRVYGFRGGAGDYTLKVE